MLGICSVLGGMVSRGVFSPQTAFFWWKYLGVVLWCWVVHACVRFVAPRLGIVHAAGWTIAISLAVELLQLTGLSAWLSSHHLILRLIFGEVFSMWDLLAAVISGLLVIPVDMALRQGEQQLLHAAGSQS
jgi:hypothetical protein